MKLFIFPYQMESKSVHNLRKAIGGCLVIRIKGSKFKGGPEKLILNWGSSNRNTIEYEKQGSPVLNPHKAVTLVSNKKRFFSAVEGRCRIPKWTDDLDEALEWVNEGRVVVGREILTGHSGKGIVFSDEDMKRFRGCKIWTQYVPKKDEFRVHVFNGKVIDVQQKKLKTEDADGNKVDKDLVNWRVRSHKNGFIYARKDIHVPEDVTQQALDAMGS
jgi:hypothetical protein